MNISEDEVQVMAIKKAFSMVLAQSDSAAALLSANNIVCHKNLFSSFYPSWDDG